MSLTPNFIADAPHRPSITVHPAKEEAAAPELTRPRKSFQKETLGDHNLASWGGDGFGFDDLVDLVNPLQHIPVVGHIYREMTGDTASAEAKIIGGGMIGGPVGLIAAGIGAVIEQETGKSLAQLALNAFDEQSEPAHTAPAAQAAANTQTLLQPLPQALAALPLNTHAAGALAAQPATLADLLARDETAAEEELPAEESATLHPEQQDKHEMILELFGQQVSSATQRLQHDGDEIFAQQAKQLRG